MREGGWMMARVWLRMLRLCRAWVGGGGGGDVKFYEGRDFYLCDGGGVDGSGGSIGVDDSGGSVVYKSGGGRQFRNG